MTFPEVVDSLFRCLRLKPYTHKYLSRHTQLYLIRLNCDDGANCNLFTYIRFLKIAIDSFCFEGNFECINVR